MEVPGRPVPLELPLLLVPLPLPLLPPVVDGRHVVQAPVTPSLAASPAVPPGLVSTEPEHAPTSTTASDTNAAYPL
jgi:hypothetical protein